MGNPSDTVQLHLLSMLTKQAVYALFLNLLNLQFESKDTE